MIGSGLVTDVTDGSLEFEKRRGDSIPETISAYYINIHAGMLRPDCFSYKK